GLRRGGRTASRPSRPRSIRTTAMASASTFDIPTLKEEIEHETVEKVLALDVDKYKYGFETAIEVDRAPKGLNEDTIRFISAKKDEPEWMLEWRLEAYKRWLNMDEPTWAK